LACAAASLVMSDVATINSYSQPVSDETGSGRSTRSQHRLSVASLRRARSVNPRLEAVLTRNHTCAECGANAQCIDDMCVSEHTTQRERDCAFDAGLQTTYRLAVIPERSLRRFGMWQEDAACFSQSYPASQSLE
jgi:hypothetical protein